MAWAEELSRRASKAKWWSAVKAVAFVERGGDVVAGCEGVEVAAASLADSWRGCNGDETLGRASSSQLPADWDRRLVRLSSWLELQSRNGGEMGTVNCLGCRLRRQWMED